MPSKEFATPEELHLAEQERELASLADEVATAEFKLAQDISSLAQFRLTYLQRFAPLYAELDEVKAGTNTLQGAAVASPEAARGGAPGGRESS